MIQTCPPLRDRDLVHYPNGPAPVPLSVPLPKEGELGTRIAPFRTDRFQIPIRVVTVCRYLESFWVGWCDGCDGCAGCWKIG